MRPVKDLEAMVVGLKAWAPAPYEVLALDLGEFVWFTDRLKGHQGVKHISIRKGQPGDERPIAVNTTGAVHNPSPSPGKSTPAPKPVTPWDADGL